MHKYLFHDSSLSCMQYNETLYIKHLLQGASNSTTPRTQIYACIILLSNHLSTKLCLFCPFICVFTSQLCLKASSSISESSLHCCRSLLCAELLAVSQTYVLRILMSGLCTFLCGGQIEQSMEQTSSIKRTALMGLIGFQRNLFVFGPF